MGAFLYVMLGLLAVLGRLLGHVLGARRELANKRRELRVQVLIDAWRSIERAAHRIARDEMRDLEHALADIQLFGTPSQTDRAARVARSLSGKATNGAAIGELLEALRVDLREEMKLGRAATPLVYWRDGHALSSAPCRAVEPVIRSRAAA
jgi:hypothetical protein